LSSFHCLIHWIDGLVKEKYRNSIAQGKVNPNETEPTQKVCIDSFYHQSIHEPIENESIDQSAKHKLEIWTRITPEEEYVKLIIYSGKIIGALLIGDTDLEEVFENLILNELDVTRYGMNLLDPDIDIEDYFD
jgi:hypothetical protein